MEETLQFGFAFSVKNTIQPNNGLDLSAQMKRAAKLGFDGIELDSRLLSNLPGSNADYLRTLSETYRLDPSCYVIELPQRDASNQQIDPMQIDQKIDPMILVQHFHMARYLGFPYVRIQSDISRQDFCELVPYAVECGIWLGLEIRLDQDTSAQLIQGCVDLVDQYGSKHTGFILDLQTKGNESEQSSELGANQVLSHELIRSIWPYTRIIRLGDQDIGIQTMAQLSDIVKHLEVLGNGKYYGWVVCGSDRLELD